MRTICLGIALFAIMTAPVLACTPHSGKRVSVPQLGAAIIIVLQHTQLSTLDIQKIRERQAEIARLASKGKESEARKVEEEVMSVLGYTKAWTRCGPGTFSWLKRAEYQPEAMHSAPHPARFADAAR
jgi:hypothetical protein